MKYVFFLFSILFLLCYVIVTNHDKQIVCLIACFALAIASVVTALWDWTYPDHEDDI